MAQTDVRQNAADYNRSLCKRGRIYFSIKSCPAIDSNTRKINPSLFLSVEVGQALQHQQVITDEADDFFVFDDRRVADAEIVE